MAQKLILCEGKYNRNILTNDKLAAYLAAGYEVTTVSGFTIATKPACYILLEKDENKVATPSFSLTGGDTLSLTIGSATSGASVYYTSDGTTPTSSSTAYSAAITVSSDTTYKAIAIKDGVESEVASFYYLEADAATEETGT